MGLLSWILGAGVAGAAIAAGVQLMSLAPPAFRLARACFLTALVSAVLSVWLAVYQSDLGASPKTVVTLIVVGLAVWMFYEAMSLVSQRQAAYEGKAVCKDVLGRLSRRGRVEHERHERRSAEAWSQMAADFIAEAYGDAERQLFLSNAGSPKFGVDVHVTNEIKARLDRLDELIRRADGIAIRHGFDADTWRERSV